MNAAARRIYIAKWPDGTFTVVSANNETDIYDCLDEFADPLGAEIFKMPLGDFAIDLSSAGMVMDEANDLRRYIDRARFKFSKPTETLSRQLGIITNKDFEDHSAALASVKSEALDHHDEFLSVINSANKIVTIKS